MRVAVRIMLMMMRVIVQFWLYGVVDDDDDDNYVDKDMRRRGGVNLHSWWGLVL
jgi:hypothetical protein